MCALSNHLNIVLQKIAPGNLRESGETKCASGCTVLLLVTRTHSLERTAKSFGSLRADGEAKERKQIITLFV